MGNEQKVFDLLRAGRINEAVKFVPFSAADLVKEVNDQKKEIGALVDGIAKLNYPRDTDTEDSAVRRSVQGLVAEYERYIHALKDLQDVMSKTARGNKT